MVNPGVSNTQPASLMWPADVFVRPTEFLKMLSELQFYGAPRHFQHPIVARRDIFTP